MGAGAGPDWGGGSAENAKREQHVPLKKKLFRPDIFCLRKPEPAVKKSSGFSPGKSPNISLDDRVRLRE
jgi:hypothetical protein